MREGGRKCRKKSFKDDPQRAKLKPQDGGQGGPEDNPSLVDSISHDPPVDQRIGDEAGEKAEIENVAPQGQKASIRKEKGPGP